MAAEHEAASARTVIEIGAMTCEACVRAVTSVLSRVPGAAGVEVDLATGRAVIAGNTQREALLAAVEKAGYDARLA